MKTRLLVLFSIVIFLNSCSENTKNNSSELIIFHAGSFSVPMKKICSAFQKENPEIKILTEAAGSRESARKISDLHKPCDILISSDYKVIDDLLIPEFSSWNIRFASNEMVIAFTEKSKYESEIDANNWYKILLKEEVETGRSNPDSDPCGSRSVLCLKLSENFYKVPKLADDILQKSSKNIRPKETDLLALLETNTVDYIFIYRSVAVQHSLKFIELPDNINLKNPDLSSTYSKVSVELQGKKPGEKILEKGEPMIYGLTILKNAPNQKTALKFIEFLLDDEKGMKIVKDCGQPSVVPSSCRQFNNVPSELKKFVIKP